MEDCELGYRIEGLFGLALKFIPDALADHLHPTTFQQACDRAVRVGLLLPFVLSILAGAAAPIELVETGHQAGAYQKPTVIEIPNFLVLTHLCYLRSLAILRSATKADAIKTESRFCTTFRNSADSRKLE
jgi:hypothetical protein